MNGNLAIQLERTNPGTIPPSGVVMFDLVTYTNGPVGYDAVTGNILINQPGRYLVDWSVGTRASPTQQGLGFQVTGSNIQPLLSPAASPIQTGEVVGFAIVETEAMPATLTLVNLNPDHPVLLSPNVVIKGYLRIFRYHFLENLDDGEATGSLAGIGSSTDQPPGAYAVALGYNTVASGSYAHAEGFSTNATGNYAHAEGYGSTASGAGAHAEGAYTIASGNAAHAEGHETEASGFMAHAEGASTIASNYCAHAEGTQCQATEQHTHAEGYNTLASGPYSHAEGYHTSTNGLEGAHIMGRHGEADTSFSWFLANGADPVTPGLAAKILSDGNAYIDVSWNSGGADYAELFETADGRPIEPGYFITFDESHKVRIANSADAYILGISSAVPSVLGNTAALRWHGKFLCDEWGRTLYENITVPEKRDSQGQVIVKPHVLCAPKLNPAWDAARPYLPRSQRPEWIAVGLLGQIRIRDDGTCIPGAYCLPDASGTATAAQNGYRVMQRTGERQVLILFR